MNPSEVSAPFFAISGRASVENRLHEGVAVVPEMGSLGCQTLEDLEVANQTLVYQLGKRAAVGSQQFATLVERDTRWGIAAVVGNVA